MGTKETEKVIRWSQEKGQEVCSFQWENERMAHRDF